MTQNQFLGLQQFYKNKAKHSSLMIPYNTSKLTSVKGAINIYYLASKLNSMTFLAFLEGFSKVQVILKSKHYVEPYLFTFFVFFW